MTNEKDAHRHSYVWLGIAIAFLPFATGRWIIPIAAWLGPMFMLRFIRSQMPVKGLLIGYAVMVAVFSFAWNGMVPVPTPIFYAIGSLFGVYLVLPYALDRFLAPRFNGLLATLVFPVAWVTVDFLNASFNPYGHWALLAYTQHGNLPLLQLLSITGIWGVTFIVVWFASIANWLWGRTSSCRRLESVWGSTSVYWWRCWYSGAPA